jgi:hypothetical protein
MHTINSLETFLLRSLKRDVITYCLNNNFLHRKYNCPNSNTPCNFVVYKWNFDGHCWRCSKSTCRNYKKHYSLRLRSFFEHFNTSLTSIFRFMLKYTSRQQRHNIILSSDLSLSLTKRIIYKLVSKMNPLDL